MTKTVQRVMFNKEKEIMNLMGMMKQAQQMQKKLQDTQENLSNQEITAVTGNGAVTAVVTGQGHFNRIKLTKEALNSENPSSVDDETLEMLEDLITSAFNQATESAKQETESQMKAITGGINIPGLF